MGSTHIVVAAGVFAGCELPPEDDEAAKNRSCEMDSADEYCCVGSIDKGSTELEVVGGGCCGGVACSVDCCCCWGGAAVVVVCVIACGSGGGGGGGAAAAAAAFSIAVVVS